MSDTERVEFDIDTVTVDEGEALEDECGMTWLQFLQGNNAGSAKAMRAAVWLHKRRADPGLKFADVHFNLQSLAVELDMPGAGEAPAVPLVEDSEPSKTSSRSSSTRSTGLSRGKSTDSPSNSSIDAVPVSSR